MNEFKMPYKTEYRKWTEFSNGDVIAPETEITKLIQHHVDDWQLISFVIVNDKLHSYPDLIPYSGDKLFDSLNYGKLHSIKFD